MKIGILGCGHMGSAIVQALQTKRAFKVIVSNPHKPHAKVKWSVDNKRVAKEVDIVFIAVRPNVVPPVLAEIKPFLKPRHILISIAAGIPMAKIKKWSGGQKKIVRVMPNLPAQVLDGMSVWKASGLNKKEKSIVRNILNLFGKEIEVKNEKLINNPVNGSGPAFIAAFLESMANVAEKIGFSKSDARMLALETVDGSLDYIEETGIDFGAMKKAVQTKGGTTEAGFKVLKKNKWQPVFEKALFATYKRTLELGRP